MGCVRTPRPDYQDVVEHPALFEVLISAIGHGRFYAADREVRDQVLIAPAW